MNVNQIIKKVLGKQESSKEIASTIIAEFDRDMNYLERVVGNVENKYIHITQVEAVRDNFCNKWRNIVSSYDKFLTSDIYAKLKVHITPHINVLETLDITKNFLLSPEVFTTTNKDTDKNTESFIEWMAYINKQILPNYN